MTIVKDYHDYYIGRAYHPRSLNSTEGWNVTNSLSWANAKILQFTNEIRSAVLVIHGEKAHSCYFGKDAYNNMIKENKYKDNKKLLLIPNASHTDLYDQVEIIRFDKIEEFYKENLK